MFFGGDKDGEHQNRTIDWTVRENVRANLRVIVKRILRKYGARRTSRSGRLRRCWSRQHCFPKLGWCHEINSL